MRFRIKESVLWKFLKHKQSGKINLKTNLAIIRVGDKLEPDHTNLFGKPNKELLNWSLQDKNSGITNSVHYLVIKSIICINLEGNKSSTLVRFVIYRIIIHIIKNIFTWQATIIVI